MPKPSLYNTRGTISSIPGKPQNIPTASLQGCKIPRPTNVQDTILNYIWWWGSSSGALGMCSISLSPLLPGPLWLEIGSTCLGSIYESKRAIVVGMMINCIWWWDSISGALGICSISSSPLLPGPLWPKKLVVPVWVPFTGSTCLGPIFESNRTSMVSMTQNCIWWWGSSSGTLENMAYPFITITPNPTLTRIVSTC